MQVKDAIKYNLYMQDACKIVKGYGAQWAMRFFLGENTTLYFLHVKISILLASGLRSRKA